MNLNSIIVLLKPYLTTFVNRMVNGMGFGLGMGISWNLQSKK